MTKKKIFFGTYPRNRSHFICTLIDAQKTWKCGENNSHALHCILYILFCSCHILTSSMHLKEYRCTEKWDESESASLVVLSQNDGNHSDKLSLCWVMQCKLQISQHLFNEPNCIPVCSFHFWTFFYNCWINSVTELKIKSCDFFMQAAYLVIQGPVVQSSISANPGLTV